ncbi:regulatory protein GemA [Emcibacter sp.]|uniref:gp16 family protein n=1 Tax=Emcibacter sp. TaxID=1979954 RepID=UPI002AA938E9|nr:regulatory protein GemA [Emcibacter sp.]
MSNVLLAQIHIAKKDLGLEDGTYRAVLHQITGKESSGDMNAREQRLVVDHFKSHGWKPKKAKKKRPASKKPFVRKIFAMWWELGELGLLEVPKSKRVDACIAFVKRMTDVEDPEWLTADQANIVIEALKKWKRRKRSDVADSEKTPA